MRNAAKNTRRITALTLVIALGVAVYLNWEYAKTGAIKDTSPAVEAAVEPTADDAEMAQAVETAGAVADGLLTEQDALEAADKNYGEAQLVSVSKDSGSEFFEQARLSREKAHDEALDSIQKTLKSASLTENEKEKLTTHLTENLENVTAENEIETLIKAKGFADCLCFLQDGKVDLTVMTGGDALTAAQVAQIRDIVLGKCKVTAQDITVVEVK